MNGSYTKLLIVRSISDAAENLSLAMHNDASSFFGAIHFVNLTSIELREIRLPLIHFFETSFGRTTERRIILVRVKDKDGAEGWGECTAGEGPFYSEEWTDTAWDTLREFLAPMVGESKIDKANQVFPAMKAVRGHRMAKAAI